MPEVVGTLKTPRLASAPSSPVAGQLYYDTGTSTLYWWNGTTWVSSAGGGALPADTTVASGTRIISNKLVAGDTQPAWKVGGDGRMDWGLGGTTAPTSFLYYYWNPTLPGYRLQMSEVAIAGAVWSNSQGIFNTTYGGSAANEVRVGIVPNNVAGAGLWFAQDTYLYRSGVNQLKTDGALTVVGTAAGIGVVFNPATAVGNALATLVGAESAYRFAVDVNGRMGWGPGNAAGDTNLYRVGASALQTDGTLYVGNELRVSSNLVGNTDVYCGGVFRSTGAMIGSAAIYGQSPSYGFIYAPAAVGGNALTVQVAGEAQFHFYIDALGGHTWGPGGSTPGDTTLFRSAAGILKTGQHFRAGLDLYAQDGNAQQVRIGNNSGNAAIDFGSGFDTNLFRSAAGSLKTNGKFITAGDLQVLAATADTQPQIVLQRNLMGAGLPGIAFGVGGTTSFDVYLYRNGAFGLQTNGSLTVDGDVSVGGKVTGNGSVPAGGTTGQVLQKTSATDYATSWTTPSAGGGGVNPLYTAWVL